jgi:hypothetical protein
MQALAGRVTGDGEGANEALGVGDVPDVRLAVRREVGDSGIAAGRLIYRFVYYDSTRDGI